MARNSQPTSGLGLSQRVITRIVLIGLLSLPGSLLPAASANLSLAPSGQTLSQPSSALAAPTITAQPVSLPAASPDLVARFSVTVTSPSPASYQWHFNGALIPGATGDSLVLPTVTAADEGSYTVRVTNSAGSVTSEAATLALDSNGNLLGDTWEQLYFGNLLQKPGDDFDGDKLTNLEEYQNATDPSVRTPYYWIGPSFAYARFEEPLYRNWKRPPGPGDTAYINSNPPELASGAAYNVNLIVNVSYEFRDRSGSLRSPGLNLGTTATWIFNGPVVLNASSLSIGSGTWIFNGPTTLNVFTLFKVTGRNTKVAINGLTTYTQRDNILETWQVGDPDSDSPGCELSFPNLTSIDGGTAVSTYDKNLILDLVSYRLATLNLPALQTITAKAKTATRSANNGVRLFARDRGVVNAARLVRFSDPNIPFSSSIDVSSDSRYAFNSLRVSGLTGVALNGVTLPTGPVNLQPPAITSAHTATATLGNPFGYQIVATNAPYTYDATPLPVGFSINRETGQISGRLSTAGTFTLNLTATNPDGQTNQALQLTVTAPVPVARPGNLISW